MIVVCVLGCLQKRFSLLLDIIFNNKISVFLGFLNIFLSYLIRLEFHIVVLEKSKFSPCTITATKVIIPAYLIRWTMLYLLLLCQELVMIKLHALGHVSVFGLHSQISLIGFFLEFHLRCKKIVMVQLQFLSIAASIECEYSEFAETHCRWLS